MGSRCSLTINKNIYFPASTSRNKNMIYPNYNMVYVREEKEEVEQEKGGIYTGKKKKEVRAIKKGQIVSIGVFDPKYGYLASGETKKYGCGDKVLFYPSRDEEVEEGEYIINVESILGLREE